MIFLPTALAGVVEIVPEPNVDARGFFTRLYCPEEFAMAGLAFTASQINMSRNLSVHTLRGLHFQNPPFAEAKIVRAVSGALYDVVIDVRPDSQTHLHWIGCSLNSRIGNALFIPKGFAHGFLTLEPQTDVLYQMDSSYVPGKAQGLRFDDPRLAITWPHSPAVVSEADKAWPLI